MRPRTWPRSRACYSAAADAWTGSTKSVRQRAAALVRKGEPTEILDRLLVAALIEVRSCERFAVLATTAGDADLAAFYRALYVSEFEHYKIFLDLARKFVDAAAVEARWQQMLAAEAKIWPNRLPVRASIPACPLSERD